MSKAKCLNKLKGTFFFEILLDTDEDSNSFFSEFVNNEGIVFFSRNFVNNGYRLLNARNHNKGHHRSPKMGTPVFSARDPVSQKGDPVSRMGGPFILYKRDSLSVFAILL